MIKKDYTVTFFYKNVHEKHIFLPIAKELKKKRIKYFFSKNLNQKAFVGFYCEEPKKIGAKISAIFLGGMDQGRVIWPNIWKQQPWDKFDLGFLPGKNWAKRWKESSHDKRSRPKYGVFNAGWPKADFLFCEKKKNVSSNKFQRK